MESILRLDSDTSSSENTSASALSADYLEAVNTARFIKAFGLTALICCLLLFLGTEVLDLAVGLGVGLFILRYGDEKFYRIVGRAVVLLSLVPLATVTAMFLMASMLDSGLDTLGWLTDKMFFAGLLGIGLLPAATGIGVGLYLMLRGRNSLFLALGICVLIALLLKTPSMSMLVLSGAVFGKGLEILATLIRGEKSDEAWQPTYLRALTGVICSGISLGIVLLLTLANYINS